MKFLGLDGRIHSISLQYKYFNPKRSCSAYHKRARELLKRMYPTSQVLEEFPLRGSRTSSNSMLFSDFYLPSMSLIVEVHGEQHYKYIPHFHKSKMDFIKAMKRDNTKKEWCDLNEIDLVVLKYSESDDEWERAIRTR